jgi:hypothetical protein
VRRLALVLALGCSGTAVAHSGETLAPPAFDLVARTSHVDYFVAKGRRVDVRRTEAFLERLSTLFGPAPEGWRIQYYRHASADGLRSHVGYAVSGVADLATGRIDSSREFHPHELVHAVTGREGLPPVFFAEGLAVALTSRGRWGERDMDELARREMARRHSLEAFLTAFTDQDPDVAYAVAGSFVGFLLEEHGIESMVAFLRGCGSSPERYERALRRAYGRSFARLTIEWLAWLRQDTPHTHRAWYEPERWPASLRHVATASAPPSPSSAGSLPPSTLVADGSAAAEPRPTDAPGAVDSLADLR